MSFEGKPYKKQWSKKDSTYPKKPKRGKPKEEDNSQAQHAQSDAVEPRLIRSTTMVSESLNALQQS